MSSSSLLVLISGLIAAALIAWLTLALRRAWKAWLLARRMARATSGEQRAERWLETNGFRILDRQVTRRATMHINQHVAQYDVRADLLVQHGDLRAIVEVKTGEAADPRTTATRRQLLEYTHIFGVDTIFLFDATRLRLHEIRFPALPDAAD